MQVVRESPRESSLGTQQLVVIPPMPMSTPEAAAPTPAPAKPIGDFAVAMHDRFNAVTMLRGRLTEHQKRLYCRTWMGGSTLLLGGAAALTGLVASIAGLAAGHPSSLGYSEPLMLSAILGAMGAMVGSVLGAIGYSVTNHIAEKRRLLPRHLEFAQRAATSATPLERAVLAELAQRWGEALRERSIEGRAAADMVMSLSDVDASADTRVAAKAIARLFDLIYVRHTGVLNVRCTRDWFGDLATAIDALPAEVEPEVASALRAIFFRDAEGDSSRFLFPDVAYKHALFHRLRAAAEGNHPQAPAEQPPSV